MEGAIWWGVFSALDQWCIPHRPGRPNTSRPTDAQLVAAARITGLNPRLLERFAKEYQVYRNPLNLINQRQQRLNAVGIAVHKIYSVNAALTSHDLADMWWDAIVAVRQAMASFGPTAELKSFCMKSLWLYQPSQATMWDSFAVRGLNKICQANHTNKLACKNAAVNFLNDFEHLFAAQNPLINDVIQCAQLITGAHYDYPRRVLDKALWLIGEEDQRKKISAWRVILETNPKVRAATEKRFPCLAVASRPAAAARTPQAVDSLSKCSGGWIPVASAEEG